MISLFVKKIFEVYPTLNILLRYLPQRDPKKRLVEYRLISYAEPEVPENGVLVVFFTHLTPVVTCQHVRPSPGLPPLPRPGGSR